MKTYFRVPMPKLYSIAKPWLPGDYPRIRIQDCYLWQFRMYISLFHTIGFKCDSYRYPPQVTQFTLLHLPSSTWHSISVQFRIGNPGMLHLWCRGGFMQVLGTINEGCWRHHHWIRNKGHCSNLFFWKGKFKHTTLQQGNQRLQWYSNPGQHLSWVYTADSHSTSSPQPPLVQK